jgi:cytochrome o ubiquinol oxidase subunit IV
MHQDLSLKEIQKEWHGTLTSYLIGFALAIILTCISFFLVITRYFSDQILLYTIVGLAILQGLVQLLLFLHVGQEAKPRWETLVFGFMVLVLLIIAIGSLWIMHDLNYRMMPE